MLYQRVPTRLRSTSAVVVELLLLRLAFVFERLDCSGLLKTCSDRSCRCCCCCFHHSYELIVNPQVVMQWYWPLQSVRHVNLLLLCSPDPINKHQYIADRRGEKNELNSGGKHNYHFLPDYTAVTAEQRKIQQKEVERAGGIKSYLV